MDNGEKAKEPWVALLLNVLFPGVGQIYAKKPIRGIIFIGASLLFLATILYVVINPEIAMTKQLIVTGIFFAIIMAVFNIFVLVDGWICVRKFNILHNVQAANSTLRVISIVICATLFITGGIRMPFALYLRNSVVQAFKIPSGTMIPTLQVGDRIFADKRAYASTSPKRWDIVVFRSPQDERKILLKRVVGLPDETIEIIDGKININDSNLASKVYYYNGGNYGKEGQKIKIPSDNYFVLGDNSATSRDSRYFGFVPAKSILGKATKIYWPLSRAGKIE